MNAGPPKLGPPKLAVLALSRLLHPTVRDGVLGDLLELWARRGGRGRRYWFWRESLAALWHCGRQRRFTVSKRGPRVRKKEADMIRTILDDARLAARQARKRPAFTLLVVGILTAGIAASSAFMSIVDGLLDDALPFDHVERIAVVREGHADRGFDASNVSYPNFRAYVDGTEIFESAAVLASTTRNLTAEDDVPARLEAAIVSRRFFEVFGAAPIRGRDFRDLTPGGRFALLTESLWHRRFGSDPGIVGRSIVLDGASHEVLGVVPGHALHPDVEVWLPLDPASPALSRSNHFLAMYGRLRPDIGIDQARRQLETVATRLAHDEPEEYGGWRPLITSLRADRARHAAPVLGLILGAAASVLFLTCANVAGLLIAVASDRGREMAVRVALGAPRRRLVRQMLTESLLLSGIAGVLGWLVGTLLAKVAIARLPPDLVPGMATFTLDGRVLVATIGLSMLTGLLFGMLPALAGTGQAIERTLNRAGSGGTRTARHGRRFLVAGQVALAMTLLLAASTLLLAVDRLNRLDLGFEPGRLLTLRLDLSPARYEGIESRSSMAARLVERVRAVPGVESASIASHIPHGGGRLYRGVMRHGDAIPPPEDTRHAGFNAVDRDFFATLGARLYAGRLFAVDDGAPVAVVNRSLATMLFARGDAVGELLHVHTDESRPRRIVGVVDDVRSTVFSSAREPQVYVPLDQVNWSSMWLTARSSLPAADLVPALRAAVQEVDPAQPVYNARTMRQRLARELSLPLLLSRLLLGFGLVAITLAACGLYGLLATDLRQRRRELAIQKALGADRATVVEGVLRQGLVPVVAGIAVGAILGGGVFRVLAARIEAIQSLGWSALAVSTAVLSIATAAAFVEPTLRAVRLAPAELLRDE